jgi:hypothetical protein
VEEVMYSKVYSVTCNEGEGDAMVSYYDETVVPAIRESEHHVGHLMIEVGDEEWILVANYVSHEAANEALGMVGDLVADLNERFGTQLTVMGEGEAVRDVS